MKRVVCGLFSLVIGVGFSGCSSSPPKEVAAEKGALECLQEKAAKITATSGMIEIGTGESSTRQMAITRARADARSNLALQAQEKIISLRDAYVREAGISTESASGRFFSSAASQLTANTLLETSPRDQQVEEKDGTFTAYVLMVLSPEFIDDFLKNSKGAGDLYERFNSSKTHRKFEKEIRAYREATEPGFF
ncbi:MAG: hypothetical protein OES84_06035 [Kiritimatiellaceae bacterium]|nr:hypothetical protein [Kiritimatiellaceae bacterium]